MTGRYRGLEVIVQIEVQGSGKQRKTFTRAVARFPMAMPRGLSITSEGFTDRLAMLVGGQDIKIGHAELDRQLRICGEDVAGVRALMENWRARNAIAAFLARDGQATVTQHQCSISRRGFQSSAGDLLGMLESVCRTVSEVQRGLEEGDASARGSEPPAAPPPPAPPAPAEPPAVARFDWEDGAEPERQPSAEMPVGLVPGVTVHSSTSEVVEITTITAQGSETSRRAWSSDEVTPASPAPLEPAVPPKEPHSEASSVVQLDVSSVGMSTELEEPLASPSPGALEAEPIPLDALLALDDRQSAGADPPTLAAGMVGRPVRVELEVERVSLTMGMGVPPELDGGHTLIGRPVGQSGPRLALRFPESRSDGISRLGYGDKLAVQGVFVSWDEFYRQALVDAL